MKNEKFINVTLNEKEIIVYENNLKNQPPFEMVRTNDRLRLNIFDGMNSFMLFDDYNDLFKFVINGTKIDYEDLKELYDKSIDLMFKIRKEDAEVGSNVLKDFYFDERELKFVEECFNDILYERDGKDIICLAKHDNFMYEICGNEERKIDFCPNGFNFLNEKGTELYVGALVECYEKSDLYWTELNRKNALKEVKLTEDEMHFVEVLLNLFDEDANIWIDRNIHGVLTLSEDCVENEWGTIYIPKNNNLFSFLGFDKPVFSINLQELVELYENQQDKTIVLDYNKLSKKCDKDDLAISKYAHFGTLKIKSEELESKVNEWIELWQSYSKNSNSNYLLGISLQQSFKDLNYDLDMLHDLASSMHYFNFISEKQLLSICNTEDKIELLLSDFDYVEDLIF